MSIISLIIEERAANIGNFLVGRLLPFRQKRAVGPFVFIDHMGPVRLSERENMDVLPHPHIGLSTLTYLFEGSIMHRDSIGTEMEIQPGEVNWMTAGRGVVHSERTPDYLRQSEKYLHGLQIWVALPKELEEIEPSFHHSESNALPTWCDHELEYKLIAGEILGKKSPVPVHSPLYFLEIKSNKRTCLDLEDRLFGESALYILEGQVFSEGNSYASKQILITETANLCAFELGENTTVYIFGGDPFPEERFINWNFVSSDKAKLVDAKERWVKQEFPQIPGESGFVPYPSF
jgi:redox-sensitive bicupin YhaK (pirin superfamily)